MRTPRIKIPSDQRAAYYHLISRTVNGQHLFRAADKEVLRRIIWQVAEYCGIQVLTYAILINHFHIVACVPKQPSLTDLELLERYERLHPPITDWNRMRLAVVRRDLAENSERAAQFRARQLALIGDISPFMQLIKQRFSSWYNHTHDRFGPLWAERFTSVLLEGNGPTVRRCMAYVDLNAVNAGIAHDPKAYRFCGYAEAVAGNRRAQSGILHAFGRDDWTAFQTVYRRLLYLTAAQIRRDGKSMPDVAVQTVVDAQGTLDASELLRCRLRYLTDSVVLGSKAFVAEQLARFRAKTGRGTRMIANLLPPEAGWPGLTSFRRLVQVE